MNRFRRVQGGEVSGKLNSVLNSGVRQGCVMSFYFLGISEDKMVRKINIETKGLERRIENKEKTKSMIRKWYSANC